MFLGILVLITALSISAVAIYYSVSGLVAIFAAAAIPIIIMGSVLEIGKLVTAVWLHKYWRQAKWWLKTYLSIATVLLMFITSMGIFGFLSKAHIEQTASAQEGVAQIERIDSELERQEQLILRAEQRIEEAEASIGEGNAAIQSQIDTEQERIDNAYVRIEPAIAEQNAIIQAAREADRDRTAPYEAQLESINQEVIRLENTASDYETAINNLAVDNSAVDPIRDQIAIIQEQISRVQGQIASGEREQIRQAQTTIGANADGSAGPNTRRAANAWIETQQQTINQLNADIAELQAQAIQTVNAERSRLTGIVSDIRTNRIPALKDRETEILATIDQVRSTESPAITRAREEIQRIRQSADDQIALSNDLIQRLRDSLTVGIDEDVEAVIQEQRQKILEANNSIDTLTEQKYTLQAEYRKLEAEVGPVKYLAEFIYGETADQNLLEEAVRWVIILIIFVFDPLAVLLLIASQATFEMRREVKNQADKESHRQSWKDYEASRAQRIVDNPGFTVENVNDESDDNDNVKSLSRDSNRTDSRSRAEDSSINLARENSTSRDAVLRDQPRTTDDGGSVDRSNPSKGISIEEQKQREENIEALDQDMNWRNAKQLWKKANPEQTVKFWKEQYILGKIEKLPWEDLYAAQAYIEK